MLGLRHPLSSWGALTTILMLTLIRKYLNSICPTGNCTFQHQYSTLGYCGDCDGVTDELKFNVIERRKYLPFPLTFLRVPQLSQICLQRLHRAFSTSQPCILLGRRRLPPDWLTLLWSIRGNGWKVKILLVTVRMTTTLGLAKNMMRQDVILALACVLTQQIYHQEAFRRHSSQQPLSTAGPCHQDTNSWLS